MAILPAIAALALSACDERFRVCVDQSNVVVDDGRCVTATSAPSDAAGGSGIPASNYRWYFTARSFSGGETVTGGSYTPVVGESYATSSRGGGFGATGEGFGAVGGGGVGE